MTVAIEITGLDALYAMFERMPEAADEAARLAVNDAASFARREGSKRVREEVAFRARYLGTDDEGALSVPKRASHAGDFAVVRARNDARSLASYIKGKPRFSKGGVTLRVGAGRTARMERAFPMKLRKGSSDIDDENYNVGLAIRLKKGERVRNKTQMRAVDGRGLYLLYGPSVAQVFDDVAVEMQDDVANYLASQFVRQFERLTRG